MATKMTIEELFAKYEATGQAQPTSRLLQEPLSGEEWKEDGVSATRNAKLNKTSEGATPTATALFQSRLLRDRAFVNNPNSQDYQFVKSGDLEIIVTTPNRQWGDVRYRSAHMGFGGVGVANQRNRMIDNDKQGDMP